MIHLATTTTPTCKRRNALDDGPFLDALDFAFRDATTIARTMLMDGNPATLGAIRERMSEFVRETDLIEAKGDSWRIVPPTPVVPTTPANDDGQGHLVPTIIGDATLYNADVLEGLRALPSGSVDLVFTSPPYNLRNNGGRRPTGKWRNSKLLVEGYERHDDAMDDVEYVEWQKEVLRECWRVLSETGAIYYNHKARIVDGVLMEPSRLNPGLPLRQIVTWDRSNGMNFSPSFYLPVSEQILIFAKPGFRLRDRKASGAKDVWRIPAERSTNKHPAPFPVDLPRMAIQTTNARVILDPFAGSGTTGVAALELGRQFIGIENGPKTFAGGVKRLREVVAHSDHDATPIPTRPHDPVLINGDGLAMLRGLPDKSVDLFLLDLPYGMTRTRFDPAIDLEAHIRELRRVVTDLGAIVCFAAQPFTTKLINAAPDLFKQDLVWEKPHALGYQQCSAKHLKAHEDILVFSKGTTISPKRSKRTMIYNPQDTIEVERTIRKRNPNGGYVAKQTGSLQPGEKYTGMTNCPRSVLYFGKDGNLHSYQKPVVLLEYLVRTFSNENDLVVDHTMGSGSTCIATMNTGRRFIGAEKGFKKDGSSIFEIAASRIASHRHQIAHRHD